MVRFATAFLTLAALRAASASTNGTAFTSMYWDCCKPDCAWEGQSDFIKPVLTCDKNDNPLRDLSAQSACDDGPATVCTDQTPWAVNDTFSYGFASVFIKGAELKSWCCSCFELEFTDTSIRGKRMIVQGINTNYNEDEKNYFSLTVPGQADWDGQCAKRFNGTFGDFFTETTSPFTSAKDCDQVPESVRPACEWRYNWYENVEGPSARWRRVPCPQELTERTECSRPDDKDVVVVPFDTPIEPAPEDDDEDSTPTPTGTPNETTVPGSASGLCISSLSVLAVAGLTALLL